MTSPDRLLRLAALATVVHTVATGIGLLGTDAALATSGSINVVLFLLGVVMFIVAFLITAGRSRDENVWFGGAFLLSGGVAPQTHRRVLLGCVGLQVVVGLAGAGLRPFSALAFAVLPPLLGLSLVAFYGARHAVYGDLPAND